MERATIEDDIEHKKRPKWAWTAGVVVGLLLVGVVGVMWFGDGRGHGFCNYGEFSLPNPDNLPC